MPARAENINAFDLKLLKALLNFRLNRNHLLGLSVSEKRKLCKSFNKDGVLTISHNYLVKVWPGKKEISSKAGLDALNQLCGILHQDYRWHIFVDDVSRFCPEGIPDDRPYSVLNDIQKGKIEKVIEEIFYRYKKFEDFEKEVIDKIEIVSTVRENKILTGTHEDDAINTFIGRIYIELLTRKAAIPIDESEDVIEEIYDSWYKLFCNIRDEMKSLPVVYFKEKSVASPVIKLAHEILNEELRPHLTKHQAKFRSWLAKEKRNPKNKNITPQELQKKYPDYDELVFSIKEVNKKLIHYSTLLCSQV